jgi:hypothetical protein
MQRDARRSAPGLNPACRPYSLSLNLKRWSMFPGWPIAVSSALGFILVAVMAGRTRAAEAPSALAAFCGAAGGVNLAVLKLLIVWPGVYPTPYAIVFAERST